MKFYRLSHDHPRLRLTGHVIPNTHYKTVDYTERALYEVVSEDGKGYMYKTEVAYKSGNKTLYYLETFIQVLAILNKASVVENRKIQSNEIRPQHNFTVTIGQFTITVTFRSEQA